MSTLAHPRGVSPVPVVVIHWRDLRPEARHDLAVRPHSDDEMETDLRHKVCDEQVRAPPLTCERGHGSDDERRHIENADQPPEPEKGWIAPPFIDV